MHSPLIEPLETRIAPAAVVSIAGGGPVSEGAGGSSQTVTYTISLSEVAASDVVLDVVAVDGTAVNGIDYQFANQTVTIPMGQTAVTVDATIEGDASFELDETFAIKIQNLSSGDAEIGTTDTASTTILNDDTEPVVNLENVQVVEGDVPGTLQFTLTLSEEAGVDVSVRVMTADVSALSLIDYNPLDQVVTIPAGSTQATFSVSIIGDDVEEDDETFVVNLSEVSNATLGTTQAIGTIIDDDGLEISVDGNASGTEGSGGTVVFTVRLSQPQSETVTVGYSTQDGSALAGSDYEGVTGGVVTFNPGETEQQVTINIIDDAESEAQESFTLQLTSPSIGSIGAGTATATILDDDIPPVLTITGPGGQTGTVTLDEGNTQQGITFTLRLDRTSDGPITVNIATAGGTATSGVDFAALDQDITFAAGETVKTVTLTVLGDTTDELNEALTLNATAVNGEVTLPENPTTVVLSNDDVRILVGDAQVIEGGTGETAKMRFTLTLSAASSHDIKLDYATANGTAGAADFTGTTGVQTLTFAAGETEKMIEFDVLGDELGEADEFFTLNFTNVQNAVINTISVRGTILDDDPFLSIGNAQVIEGGAGTTKTLVFTVTLLRVSGAVTVDFATSATGSNPATAGPSGDYVAASGTLSFAEGETTKTISVTVNGDANDESDETFLLTLSNPSNPDLPSTTTATGTIIDDEGLLTVTDASLVEGDSGTANMVFVVNLLNRVGSNSVTVNYATSDGTAVSTGEFADFTTTSGTLTFAAGVNQQSILVPVRGDLLREGDQGFTLTLSGATNASIGTATAAGTIIDNDPVPAFSVSGGSVVEGDDGSAELVFTVSLAGSSETAVSVDFSTMDGTALAGSDFTAVNATTLIFAPGQTSTTLAVPLLGDTTVEGNETVLGVLLNSVGASIATGSAAGTIVDDDIVVTLSAGDFASPVAEGNSGTTTRSMTVTLSTAPLAGNTVTVNFIAIPGTASAGTDYALLTASPLVFAAGETSKTIDINVMGDTINEAGETFRVTLTGATGGKLGTAEVTGTIADDDTVVSVSGGAVNEGNAGTAELVFTISLNAATGGVVTVDFTTQNGTATAGEDYTLTTQSVTFGVGETTKTVIVPVLGDVTPELSETVLGVLSNAVGATIGASTPGTIRNDEILVSIAGFAGPVAEGDTGTSAQSMTVTLSEAPLAGSTVVVSFAVAAGTATAGSDFTTVTTSPLVFNPGETSKTIDFTILGDTRDEADETFTVTLVSATNAAIDTTAAMGTIADDDASPTLSIGDATITEGNTGTQTLAFTVTLAGVTDQTVTVKASTTLLAGDLAVAAGDFTALNDVLITFAPGELTKEVAVSIVGDNVDEQTETFHVVLSDAVNATLLDGEALGTIVDNDIRSVAIFDAGLVEGDSGTTVMMFTVSLPVTSAQTVTVDYQTANGTATEGAAGDYLAASGTLTFTPGQTSQMVSVTINGDLEVEPDETLLVRLSNATNATISDGEAVGTIRTDETKYTIANASSIEEATSSTGAKMVFVVTRTGDLTLGGTVSFATIDGDAKSSGARPDFDARTGTAIFAAGEATAQIEVQLRPDTHHEIDETFTLRLNGSTGGVLVDGMGVAQSTLDATGTITNNDNRPTFSINDASVNEGTTGAANQATFTVRLSGINEVETMTVDFLTMAGTARDAQDGVFGIDFNAVNATTLTFAVGETTKTLQVTAVGDTVDEDNETFTVVLQNAKAGTEDAIITDAEGLGTIIDDDVAPLLTFANGDQTVSEGTIGNSTFKPKIELRVGGAQGALAFSEKPITVKITTTPGTATAGVDYIAVNGGVFTLTIPAGENTAELEYTIIGDAIREADETFSFTVSEPQNVQVSDGGVKITIQNDDPVPQLAISAVTVIEGDSGTSDMVFTVALQGATDKTVTVNFATADGTAVSKGGLVDFIAAAGALSFAPGETTKTIAVKVIGDTWAEADETMTVTLSGAANATILTASATGTILNGGDTTVGLVVQDAASVENPFTVSGGTTTPVSNPKLTFKVELTKAIDTAVTFTAQTRNGTAIATGNSDSDYVALTQSFTITAGSTSVDVPVSIQGDTIFESTESFFLGVGAISGGVVEARGEGRGVLFNDDLQFVDSRTLRYIDQDGDLATLKITKGALTSATLTFGPVNAATGGRVLQLIDFTGNPGLFNGTSVRITVEPQIGFAASGLTTDGSVDVGFIRGAIPDNNTLQFTRGIDFGSIVVPGDVGKITAGDLFTTPSIAGKISVQSMGVRGTTTGAPDNISAFLSTVNAISISGDMMGIVQVIGSGLGSINSLKIEGALRGDATDSTRQSGIIFFTGTLGKATIGEIIGGAATDSGVINGNTSFTAKIGSIKVLGDIVGGTGTRSGRIVAKTIGSVIVEGDVIGGGGVGTDSDGTTPRGSDSGEILATRSIGNLRIDGDVIGGVQRNTGIISSGGTIGTLRIGGSLIGGNGSFDSGVVIVNQVLSNLVITGDVIGGTGERSGSVQVGGTLTKFTIGKSGATTGGNVMGGAGDDSGTISAGAGINQSTGDFVVSGGTIGNGLLHGDLMGGAGNGSGGVQVGGTLTKLDIRGDLVGGNSPAAGVDSVARETVQTGFVLAGRLTQMTLSGDLRAGSDLGTGLADSGSIRVHENIGTLTILGNVVGNESVRAVISAGNNAPAVNGVAGPAISRLTIGKLTNGVVTGGMASFLNVLAGYAEFGTTSDALGSARNADAKIGTVTIRGDMEATNIVAGADTGADGLFGTADDVPLTGTGVVDREGVVSSIAKVIVGGNVLSNDDEHGIVAQLVSAISATNLASGFSLAPKAGNDFTEIAEGTNVQVNEVSV